MVIFQREFNDNVGPIQNVKGDDYALFAYNSSASSNEGCERVFRRQDD